MNTSFLKNSLSENNFFLFKNSSSEQKTGNEKIQLIAAAIQDKLFSGEDRDKYLLESDAFIKKYRFHFKGSKIAKAHDRAVMQFRPAAHFFFKENQKSYKKWQTYEMPEEIYKYHPEFCQFLESSSLLSQMKVTKDRPFEIENEAAILVEGQAMKWSQIDKKFEYVYSKRFDEKFIVEKATRHIYTYLDDGKGLQKHHPYLGEKKIISKLTAEEYEQVQKSARLFIRPEEASLSCEERESENQKRKHILQIVSSYSNKGNSSLHELLINPVHPYIRMICGEDNLSLNMCAKDVYEVGYRAKQKITFPFIFGQGQFFPFIATNGLFRSPDAAEYVPCDKRVVTNIPLTSEEAERFYNFTEKYHREHINLGNLIGFHIYSQNCTTYVRKALLEIGIAVPTEISALQIIKRISPLCFVNLSRFFINLKKTTCFYINHAIRCFPEKIQTGLKSIGHTISWLVKKIFETLALLPLTVVHLVLGDGSGNGGLAFVTTGEPPQEIKAGNWKKWFFLSNYRFHLPGVLQEWQIDQASTEIYNNPIKLTIVPKSINFLSN
jgi:hypothetical protein